jgi:predicted solute-binding protein
MTNNKQQTAVKLYTEEQVREALRMTLGSLKISTENDIISALTHIELPSDEEIEKESFDLYANHNTYSLNVRQYKAFKGGAKWMRDKIQGCEQ